MIYSNGINFKLITWTEANSLKFTNFYTMCVFFLFLCSQVYRMQLNQHWFQTIILDTSIRKQRFYRKLPFSGWLHWFGEVIRIHSNSMIWVHFTLYFNFYIWILVWIQGKSIRSRYNQWIRHLSSTLRPISLYL